MHGLEDTLTSDCTQPQANRALISKVVSMFRSAGRAADPPGG